MRTFSNTEPALITTLRAAHNGADSEGFVSRWPKHTRCDVYELPGDATHVRARRHDTGELRLLPRTALGPLQVDPQTWGQLPADETPVHHQRSTPPLFAGGTRAAPDDIAQGALGSCELLAAAAQVTRRYPRYLPSQLQATASGVSLRCYPGSQFSSTDRAAAMESIAPGEPAELHLSLATLVSSHGTSLRPYGARGTGPHFPSWPGLLEKAFAKTQGERYFAPRYIYAMSWLTGCPTVYQVARPQNRQALLRDLQRRHRDHECITADVQLAPENPYPHAYEVLSVSTARQTLTLRCPAMSTSIGLLPAQQLTFPATALGRSIVSCLYTVGAGARLAPQA